MLWLVMWAEAIECPSHDLYAYKLDAYAVELYDEVIRFQLKVEEDEIIQPDVTLWLSMLQVCKANRTVAVFSDWQESWEHLTTLGVLYQSSKWFQKPRLRRQIRMKERVVALNYAHMLQALELETGISVVWNVEGHPFAKGMVSAGRGSTKVYQYIYHQFGYVQ